MQQHISVCMTFNIFTFTQTMLKMAFTASCKWLRQEHRAETVRTPTAPMWLQVKLHWTLKTFCPFWGGTTSYFVLQLIYGFSFWIHHFVISDLMCKFLTWACLSLQRFQMKALGHGYTMNPQPPSKKHLVKGGGGKQTSLTSTKVHKWQN